MGAALSGVPKNKRAEGERENRPSGSSLPRNQQHAGRREVNQSWENGRMGLCYSLLEQFSETGL